jgi:hypothetical protein
MEIEIFKKKKKKRGSFFLVFGSVENTERALWGFWEFAEKDS